MSYQSQVLIPQATANSSAKNAPVPASSLNNAKKATLKLSFKEKQELEQLPTQLASLEQEQTEIQNKLADVNFYKTEPDAAKQCQIRITQIEEELLEKLARWEDLESRGK